MRTRALQGDFSQFIRNQLSSIGRPIKEGDRDIFTTCASPAHEDSSPSMGIRKDGRTVNCFSCQFTGTWNSVAKLLGLMPLPGTGKQSKHDAPKMLVAQMSAISSDVVAPATEAKLPRGIQPWPQGKPYRGYSAGLLQRLHTGIYTDWAPTYHGHPEIERIYWPFYQCDQLVGGTGRVLKDPPRLEGVSDEDYKLLCKQHFKIYPKYKNTFAKQASHILWPYDLFGRLDTVILCEGPSSTMRILDTGLPALAILGRNWTNEKRALLSAKGVRKVICLFDGDDAGRSATQQVLASLEHLFTVHVIALPEGSDPGDMSTDWLNYVIEQFQHIHHGKQ